MASAGKNVSYEDILAVYNSISPSRTRWVRNRNELKNRWKELFQILEKASGRDGVKIGVFDPNWHTIAQKGQNASGAVNKVGVKINETWTKDQLPKV